MMMPFNIALVFHLLVVFCEALHITCSFPMFFGHLLLALVEFVNRMFLEQHIQLTRITFNYLAMHLSIAECIHEKHKHMSN